MPNLVLYTILISMFFLEGGFLLGCQFLFRVSKAFGDYAIGVDHHGALQEFILRRFLNP